MRHLSAECLSPDGSWTVELMPGPRSLITPGLALGDRLRFAAYGARLLAARRRTDPDDATSAPAADTVTLADHVARHLGPRVLARMVAPVFRCIRSWDPAETSAAFFATTMPHMIGRNTVHVLKGGMNSLSAALSRGLTLLLNTRALRIDAPAGGPCRVVVARDGRTGTLEAGRVICAVEGANAAALVPGPPPEDREFLEQVRYNPLGMVHIRLNRQVAPRMALFANGAGGTIATYQQIPGDAAQGSYPQLYAQLPPEAGRHAIAAGDLDADRADHHNQWVARMLPEFYPGYGARLRRFLDRQAAGRGRVQFCRGYLAQALVTGAAASGKAMAMRLLAG